MYSNITKNTNSSDNSKAGKQKCFPAIFLFYNFHRDRWNFFDEEFFYFFPVGGEADFRPRVALRVFKIHHALQYMVIVVSHHRILRFEPFDNVFQRLNIVGAPIEIKKITLSPALGNGGYFYYAYINPVQHADCSVPQRLLFRNKKRISNKADFGAEQLGVYRVLFLNLNFKI